jgi:hypothetical protein
MLQIVIACTRNGQFVPTGIETDVDTFIALPEDEFRVRNSPIAGTPLICGIESGNDLRCP